jgi:hypothetical protein
MLSRTLHIVLGCLPLFLAAASAHAVSCSATCSMRGNYRLIDHAYDIKGEEAAAFVAACRSAGGQASQGGHKQCGGHLDVWCWNPRTETITGSGSGYADSEFEARMEAQNDCKADLPSSNDCTTYVTMGLNYVVIDSVSCN